MAIVKGLGPYEAIKVQGKLGRPNGFGHIQFGWSLFGDFFDFAGYYKHEGRHKTQRIVKTRHYWPVNTITSPRVAVRSTFADSVLAWQALSDSEKAVWRTKASKRGRYGYHLFISNYIKTH